MFVFAGEIYNEPWFILIAIIVLFALIGGISFLIYKLLNRNKKDEKPTEEEIAEETMSRYLEDVEDPKTEEEFKNYNEGEKNKENKNQ